MKKRLLSVALVIVMLLSLLPAVALADDETPAEALTTQDAEALNLVIDLSELPENYPLNSSQASTFKIGGELKTVTPGEVNTFTVEPSQTISGSIYFSGNICYLHDWDQTGLDENSDYYWKEAYDNQTSWHVGEEGTQFGVRWHYIWFAEMSAEYLLANMTGDTLTLKYTAPVARYALNITPNDASMGTASASLTQNSGDNDMWTLYAYQNEGYIFKEFQTADGESLGTGNNLPDNNNVYRYVLDVTISEDTDVVAVFRGLYDFSCISSDETMGTVTYSYDNYSYGTYDSYSIHATANSGYKFLYWLPQGAEDVEENRIHNNSNYRVTADMTLVAYFQALPSEMTLVIDLTEYDGPVTDGFKLDGETVTPAAGQVNTYTLTPGQSFGYGKVTLQGIPYARYSFTLEGLSGSPNQMGGGTSAKYWTIGSGWGNYIGFWSTTSTGECTVGFEGTVPVNDLLLSLADLDNPSIVIKYNAPVAKYAMTITSNDETMGTATAELLYHDSDYNDCDVYGITATPAEGYLFQWVYDAAEPDGQKWSPQWDGSCTVEITKDTDLVAQFRAPFTVTAVSADPAMGTASVERSGDPQPTYEYWRVSWQAAPGYVVEKITSNKSDQEWIPWEDSYNMNVREDGTEFTVWFQPLEMTSPEDADCAVAKPNGNWFQTTTQLPTSLGKPIAGRAAAVYFPIHSSARVNNVTAAISAVCGEETLTGSGGNVSFNADQTMYLVFPGVGPIPEGTTEMEVTVTLTQGENTLGTFTRTVPVTLQDMVLNEDFRYVTHPNTSSYYAFIRDPGPEIHSVFAEETADGYNLFFATARGVYQYTPGAEKDMTLFGSGSPRASSNTNDGVYTVGPDGEGGYICVGSNNGNNQINIYRLVDGTWTMIPDTNANNGSLCGVVFNANDIWCGNQHWDGTSWSRGTNTNFTFMYRVSDTEAAGYDNNGNYWTFSDGTWTQGETAPDTTAMKPNSWTNVATAMDHNGDWYAFVPGRQHKSSDTFGGETRQGYDVYKWDGEQWVFQNMPVLDDPNDDPTEQQVRIRPDGVTTMAVPAPGITIMYGDSWSYGACYIYTADATISFDSNGGSEMEPISAPMFSPISAPTVAPEREGYTFVGWYISNQAIAQSAPAYVWSVMPAKDITLYAKWIEAGSGEDPFVEQRAQATASLTNEYNKLDQNEYSEDVWAQIEEVYAAGLANIAAADSYNGVFAALNEALDAMNELARQTSAEATVAVTVEKFTVDGEYIVEPVLVTVPKYTQASVVVTDVLKEQFPDLHGGTPYAIDGTVTDGFYLQGIYFYNNEGEEDYLGEFTMGDDSGWVYCVNGDFPGFGAASYGMKNHDVMRWQYTINGYGADVGNTGEWSTGSGVQVADKDALIWRIAEINAAGEQDEYPTYADAMAVLKDIPASQEAVDTALAALVKGEASEPAAQVVSASLTLAGDIGVNYYVIPNDALLADEGAYAQFTVKGAESEKIMLADLTPDNDGRYCFTQYVAAKEMVEQITLKLYTGVGSEVALTSASGAALENGAVYSVAKYVKSVSDATKPLAEKLASFGAYAQTYFAYEPVAPDEANADAIVGADVSGVSVDDLSAYATTKDGAVTGVTVSGVSLTLDSLTTLNVTFTGKAVANCTVTVNGEPVTPVKSGSKYRVHIPNIAAKDLDVAYTIVVTSGDETLTLTASALSYARNTLRAYAENADKTALCDMVRALYEYSVEANEYFGA